MKHDAAVDWQNLPTPEDLDANHDEYYYVGFYLRVARFLQYLARYTEDAYHDGSEFLAKHRAEEDRIVQWLVDADKYLPAWYVTYRIGEPIPYPLP